MKAVIYTVVTGSYDNLLQPLEICSDFDYICFSNDIKEDKIGVWKIKRIPYKTSNNILLSRYPKILPHIVLPEYDYSLYLDANIQITDSTFYAILSSKIDHNVLISQVPHPYRKCVYQEIYACWTHNMISIFDTIILRYKLHKIGMPEDFGLLENNLIFRNHKNIFVQNLAVGWWRKYMSWFVYRDQLSLMPTYWENQFYPDLFFGEDINTTNSPCLKRLDHNQERRQKKKSKYELFLMRISNGAERRGWL